VIVRDLGDTWQVVMQTDHADLCAAVARAWAAPGPRHDSLVRATERHDDGWAVWEASPRADATGKPVSFLEVDVTSHLAFYRACIAAVTDEDAYAGLLVSTHGAGIYRQRYGLDPGLKLSHADAVADLVETFVAEQEDERTARLAAAGVDEARLWEDYRLLQFFDRISLHFCMRDVATEHGTLADYSVAPAGGWAVTIDPWPLAVDTAGLTLLRRLVPKTGWEPETFGTRLLALEPEPLSVTLLRP
jgi:hypothetical protein